MSNSGHRNPRAGAHRTYCIHVWLPLPGPRPLYGFPSLLQVALCRKSCNRPLSGAETSTAVDQWCTNNGTGRARCRASNFIDSRVTPGKAVSSLQLHVLHKYSTCLWSDHRSRTTADERICAQHAGSQRWTLLSRPDNASLLRDVTLIGRVTSGVRILGSDLQSSCRQRPYPFTTRGVLKGS